MVKIIDIKELLNRINPAFVLQEQELREYNSSLGCPCPETSWGENNLAFRNWHSLAGFYFKSKQLLAGFDEICLVGGNIGKDESEAPKSFYLLPGVNGSYTSESRFAVALHKRLKWTRTNSEFLWVKISGTLEETVKLNGENRFNLGNHEPASAPERQGRCNYVV